MLRVFSILSVFSTIIVVFFQYLVNSQYFAYIPFNQISTRKGHNLSTTNKVDTRKQSPLSKLTIMVERKTPKHLSCRTLEKSKGQTKRKPVKMKYPVCQSMGAHHNNIISKIYKQTTVDKRINNIHITSQNIQE